MSPEQVRGQDRGGRDRRGVLSRSRKQSVLAVAVCELAEGVSPWAIPWPCIHEFLALATHPRIFSPPTPLPKALEQVDAWLESPSLHLLSEQPGAWDSLRPLLVASKTIGPAVHDARIAALCLHHGVRGLWTADRDFSRFGELRVRNPLT